MKEYNAFSLTSPCDYVGYVINCDGYIPIASSESCPSDGAATTGILVILDQTGLDWTLTE